MLRWLLCETGKQYCLHFYASKFSRDQENDSSSPRLQKHVKLDKLWLWRGSKTSHSIHESANIKVVAQAAKA